MRAYQRASKSQAGLDDQSWNELKVFLEKAQKPLNYARKKYDIEDNPPTINEKDEFTPHGWVGSYPGGINVRPEGRKISLQEYKEMISDLKGWLEILSPPSLESVLPFSPDVLLDARSLYESYSRKLIDLTEVLLSHRIPREVRLLNNKGRDLKGTPVFNETLQLMSQGSQDIVYRSREFTFHTLPNLLLTRFHAELAGRLGEITQEHEYFQEELKSQISFHQEFIDSGIPADLLSESMSVNFFDAETLEKTRRLSSAEMEEIIDLWEAFKNRKSMELSIRERLDTAIKPASKVYELWSLFIIIEVLENILETEMHREEGSWAFEFDSEVKLHYNERIHGQSRFIKKFGKWPAKPDFMIEKSDEVVWIGDAKYKVRGNIDLGDYQRFLSYLLDYMPSGENRIGSILYISDETEIEMHEETGDYRVAHVPLRPLDSDENKKKIYKQLNNVVCHDSP